MIFKHIYIFKLYIYIPRYLKSQISWPWRTARLRRHSEKCFHAEQIHSSPETVSCDTPPSSFDVNRSSACLKMQNWPPVYDHFSKGNFRGVLKQPSGLKMPYLQENKWDGETKLSAREIYICVNLHRYMRTCMHTYTCPGMQTYNGQIDAMQIA